MRSAEKSYIPDSVDRGNPRPLNEQVYDEICRAIAEKRLVPGDILPKRERLAEAFGVGVDTVRQAGESLSCGDCRSRKMSVSVTGDVCVGIRLE